MRVVHQLPEASQITFLEHLDRLVYPFVFRHGVTSPSIHRIVRHKIRQFLECHGTEIAKVSGFHFPVDSRQRLLALASPFVIFGSHQIVILVRVGDHQFVAVNIQGYQIVIQRGTIQRDGMFLLSHSHGKLVHNPAIHPHEIVFRVLGHFYQLDRV